MKRLLIICLVAIIAFVGVARAQEASINVKAPQVVGVGQQFSVQFEVNAKCKDFRGPSFKGLSLLGGPSTSQSSSFSMVNGKTTHSFSMIYTYYLQADQEGIVTVGPATCEVEGKKISSRSFSIKADKSANTSSNSGGGRSYGYSSQRQSTQRQEPQSTTIDSKSLFARASISKTNPYQGEQLLIIYKIYTQIPISQFQIEKLPGNKGFWSEDLSEGKEVRQYEETVDGRHYQVAEIRRGAMFAQESGKLRIEPLDLDVLAIVQRQRQRTGTIWDLFDDPFFNTAQSVQKHLTTNAISVNVKPLPAAPEGFSGGVGSFDVSARIDTREVKANEAVTYTVTVSGTGNLMLIDAPELNISNEFEIYDPKTSDKINHSNSGISGSRTFEWVLIPRTQGKYTIPALNFVYFDPKTGKYVTKQTQAFDIKVNKGDAAATRGVTTAKSDVRILNSDINYIHIGKSRFSPIHSKAFGMWFWIIAIFLGGISLAVLLWGLKHQAMLSDEGSMRLNRATKLAKKRLRSAEKYLNEQQDELFYEEIYKAIWGCLSDKFNIPLSSLSSESVEECLSLKNVEQDLQQHILSTIHEVDFARFAPGDKSQTQRNIYEKSLQMIMDIEKRIK